MNNYQHKTHDPKVGRTRIIIWGALLGILVLIVWAYFAQIDQVTRASGTVIASARTQDIQAVEGGVLTDILVKEGDEVKKGQLLVTLEEERAQAAVANSGSKIAALKAKIARLEAEIFERPLVFPEGIKNYSEYIENQTQLYNRRRQAIDQDVNSLQRMMVLAQQ